jgi:hypothetical protein
VRLSYTYLQFIFEHTNFFFSLSLSLSAWCFLFTFLPFCKHFWTTG